MATKEEIYDEQISPLMTQITAICKEHKVAHLCAFSLDLEEELCCITGNISEDYEPPERMKNAYRAMYPEQQAPMMMTVRDGCY